MRRAVMLVLLAAMLASRHAPAAERFAVASGHAGVGCLATTRALPTLPMRVPVTITSSEPATTLRATVSRRLPGACRALAGADLPGPFYALDFDAPGPQDTWLGVADFGGRSRATFHACTSSEGVHLSAWSGPALRGRRLWHSYVYLGYDVDPTCGADQTGEAPPR